MSDHEEQDRKKQPPYIDESLLINTNSRLREIERQQAEDKEYQRGHDSKQRLFNLLLTIFTGLLFVTSVISDVLMFRYVNLTKRSADAAQSAASAATTAAGATSEQTKLLRQQLEATTGAALYFDWPFGFSPPFRRLPPTQYQQMQIQFFNRGHATATHIQINVLMSIRSIPENKTLREFERFKDSIPDITPTVPPSPSNEGVWRHGYSLAPRESEMLDTGHAALVVDMSLSYNNGFQNTNTGACGAYLGFTIGNRGHANSPSCAELPTAMDHLYNLRKEAEKLLTETHQENNPK